MTFESKNVRVAHHHNHNSDKAQDHKPEPVEELAAVEAVAEAIQVAEVVGTLAAGQPNTQPIPDSRQLGAVVDQLEVEDTDAAAEEPAVAAAVGKLEMGSAACSWQR